MYGSHLNHSPEKYGPIKASYEKDEGLGIRPPPFTESQKRRLQDIAKPSFSSSAHDYQRKSRQQDLKKCSSPLRSTLGTSRHYAHDEVDLEDESKSYSHKYDTFGSEKKNMEHRKKVSLSPRTYNAMTDNHYKDNIYECTTNGSYIQETSANHFLASNTHKKETLEKHMRDTYNPNRYVKETNRYDNPGAEKCKKDTKSYSCQTRGGSAKQNQDTELDGGVSLKKPQNNKLCTDTYDRQAPSMKHSLMLDTFDNRGLDLQSRHSPDDSAKSNSLLYIMDNTSKVFSHYRPQDSITVENQKHQSDTEREIYEKHIHEREENDKRFFTRSDTYKSPEKHTKHVTDNGIHNNQDQDGTIEKSIHLGFRFMDDEHSYSTHDYREREKSRANEQQKKTVFERMKLDKTERRSKEVAKPIAVENQNHQSDTENGIYEKKQIKGKEKDKRFLMVSDPYGSQKNHTKNVTEYDMNDNHVGTKKNSQFAYRSQNDENSSYSSDYRQKFRVNVQEKKTPVDRPSADIYNCDKEKDEDIDELKNREKLREYGQQRETIVDSPVTDIPTSEKEKDREIEMLKKMSDRLKLEKLESERSDKKKDREFEKLKKMYERLKLEKQETERRSNELNIQLSRQMKHSKHFENCNDDFSSSRTAEEIRLLYDKHWVELCKWITKNFRTIPEINIIQYLSHLFKSCYKECIYLADNQIRQFLLLGDKDAIPKHEEHPELFELRKQYTRSDGTRKHVRKIVKDKVQIAESLSIFNIEIIDHGLLEKVDRFLQEFIDTCWLMTVSEPALSLNFDVVGKMYSDCANHFSVYSLKRNVDDPTKTDGTVYEVVWPCVQLKSTSEVYKKGDVILIKKKTNEKCTQTESPLF